MKKFEYTKTTKYEELSEKELNEWGKNGWELVHFNHFISFYYIFKRELL
jgi:hypothetical protein